MKFLSGHVMIVSEGRIARGAWKEVFCLDHNNNINYLLRKQ